MCAIAASVGETNLATRRSRAETLDNRVTPGPESMTPPVQPAAVFSGIVASQARTMSDVSFLRIDDVVLSYAQFDERAVAIATTSSEPAQRAVRRPSELERRAWPATRVTYSRS